MLAIYTLIIVFALIIIYQYFFGQKFPASPKFDGRFIKTSTVIDKMKRNYSYFIPTNLNDKVSILYILHGAQDTGTIFRKRLGYGFDKIAEKEKFIAIYPNGYKKSWNDCRLETKYPAKTKKIDDYKFLKTIKREISQKHSINIESVYIFGYSNGGQLVNRICMENPEFIKGAGIVAANLPVPNNIDCIEKQIPVPIIFLSGTNDKTNPFNGGMVNVLNIKKMGIVKSSDETLDYWIKLAGCDNHHKISLESPIKKESKTKVEKRIWKKGQQNYILQYVVSGGGHTIPNKIVNFPRILGPTNHDINFTDEVWRFFRQL